MPTYPEAKEGKVETIKQRAVQTRALGEWPRHQSGNQVLKHWMNAVLCCCQRTQSDRAPPAAFLPAKDIRAAVSQYLARIDMRSKVDPAVFGNATAVTYCCCTAVMPTVFAAGHPHTRKIKVHLTSSSNGPCSSSQSLPALSTYLPPVTTRASTSGQHASPANSSFVKRVWKL